MFPRTLSPLSVHMLNATPELRPRMKRRGLEVGVAIAGGLWAAVMLLLWLTT